MKPSFSMQRKSTSLGVSLQFADYIAQYYLSVALVHLSRLLTSRDSHVAYIAEVKLPRVGHGVRSAGTPWLTLSIHVKGHL